MPNVLETATVRLKRQAASEANLAGAEKKRRGGAVVIPEPTPEAAEEGTIEEATVEEGTEEASLWATASALTFPPVIEPPKGRKRARTTTIIVETPPCAQEA